MTAHNQEKSITFTIRGCPHCGKTDSAGIYGKSFLEPLLYVACAERKGGCGARTKGAETIEEAIANWNMRPVVESKPEEKPRTMTIAGIEVPMPITEAPELNDCVFSASCFFSMNPEIGLLSGATQWGSFNKSYGNLLLRRGILHTTKEAAIAHANALIKATKDAMEAAR